MSLSEKKKSAKMREMDLMNKETEIIEKAKEKYGIDF